MIFNIPQFIDKEDKIVGPLTAKQLGWLFLGGGLVLILWNLLDAITFYIVSIPIAGIASAFAFYRPYNQSLLQFIYFTFLFLFRDKVYIWKRLPEKIIPLKKVSAKKAPLENTTMDNSQKIQEISKLLDSKK